MIANEKTPEWFTIFGEKPLSEFLSVQNRKLQSVIQQESDDYISNINEEEFVSFLVEQLSIIPPVLDFNNVSGSSTTRLIPAERFPSGFDVCRGNSYPKDVFIYHIPYDGDIQLLQYDPEVYIDDLNNVRGYIQDAHLCFEIIAFYNDFSQIKQNAQSRLNKIQEKYSQLISKVFDYNYTLKWNVERIIEDRKQRIDTIVKILGVPIKKQENLPQTYEIPTPQRTKHLAIKPQVIAGQGVEFSIDESIYIDILQTIHDVGKVFERYPSTYSGKREEDLRDHFLLYLQPRYKGSATGETFNKKGKTDILIRYNNATVFIAECKFWKGSKAYLDTINQLLSYLTWRDSKAAVVIFVRNRDFSSVLKSVEQATPKHLNYVEFINMRDETWFNYKFHLDGDPNREVDLGVLLFHLPPTEKETTND